MMHIAYLVPNVGPVEIPLYAPADQVYSLLRNAGEIQRLARLRHIGALEYAYPGVSHSRWDYTMSMLYVVTRLRRLVPTSQFSLGAARFSSMAAALQCLALLSNIGHLPGTYSVEKGVARYLLSRSQDDPLNFLFEHALENNVAAPDTIIQAANAVLQQNDYLVLSKLCAILKLVTNFRNTTAVPRWLCHDLCLPFILPDLRSADRRWSDLDTYFDISRRLAYLNRDTALVDSPINVGLSPLLSNLVDPKGLTREALVQSQEITSAYEHTVYERFYHAGEARKTTAVVARYVLERLRGDVNPAATLARWMYGYDIEDVVDPGTIRRRLRKASLIGTISMRSFFLNLSGLESEVEDNLERLLGSNGRAQIGAAVAASKYVPPDSQHALEPPHLHLDALLFGEVKPRHVGLLLRWAAEELDDVHHDPTDVYPSYVKPEVARIYEDLLVRLVSVAWPGISIEIRAWPLSRLGKFKAYGEERVDIAIWLASSDLDDKLTKHIVRDKSAVLPAYRAIRDELRGLAQLRAQLRKSWQGSRTRPRRRHFLITASVSLSRTTKEGRTEREFDGGILQVSSRSGSPLLYLLETKGAQTSSAAVNRLSEKLTALDLRGDVTRLRSRSAYVALAAR